MPRPRASYRRGGIYVVASTHTSCVSRACPHVGIGLACRLAPGLVRELASARRAAAASTHDVLERADDSSVTNPIRDLEIRSAVSDDLAPTAARKGHAL
jgi:hypothetical protein